MPKGLAQMGRELYLTRLWDQRRGPAPPYSRDDGLLRSGLAPCLVTVLRMAAHQKADKGAGMELAEVLVRAGHLRVAAQLIRSGAGRAEPGEDLLRLVVMAGEAGDLDGAQALAESLTDRQLRDRALVALVPAMARAGERQRAVALAEAVRYPHNWPEAWRGLAEAVADSGDHPAALRYAARAAEHADGLELGRVLLTSMEIADAVGDHAPVRSFADRVGELVRQGAGQRALVMVLAFEARRGDLERLDGVLESLAGAAEDAEAGAGAQEADGDPDALCLTILARPLPPFDASVLPELLEEVTETVDRPVALALADRAEQWLRSDTTGFGSVQLREALALLLARHGHAERAMALADWIAEPDLRAARKAEIIEALARAGHTDQAEPLARASANLWARSRTVMAVITELAQRGETTRAEALIPTIPDHWGRDEALIAIISALARQGNQDRAEDLAHTIHLNETRARALAELATASPDPARTRTLAARAAFLGGWSMVLEDLEEIAPGGALAIAEEVLAWREAHGYAEGEA